MTRARRPGRRWAAAVAAGLVVGLPVAAFFAAPGARADDPPGSGLAGIGASTYGSAVQVSPLTPGLVGAGDVTEGNLVEAAIPYSTASTTTGPSSSCVSSPAYPGDTAAGAGDALSTFAPQMPSSLVTLLNDPVVARADYPAELQVGTSSTYSAPGAGGAGVGTAGAEATPGGATCESTTAAESFADAEVTVGSSTVTSSTKLAVSTVSATSSTDVGTISLLGGEITLADVHSSATATSDGATGQPSSEFAVGQVRVLGHPASVGPDGITLSGSSTGPTLVPDLNQALVALEQAGISVHTVSPVETTNGAQATVTSGGLVIAFEDQSIPNPDGAVPVSAVGLDLDVGFSQATADATALPPFAPVSGSATTGGASTYTPSAGSTVPASGSSGVLPSSAGPTTPSPTAGVTAGGKAPVTPGGSTRVPAYTPAAAVLGVPVRVAWVVAAIVLSLIASGPLLGYANWQLLRGRSS